MNAEPVPVHPEWVRRTDEMGYIRRQWEACFYMQALLTEQAPPGSEPFARHLCRVHEYQKRLLAGFLGNPDPAVARSSFYFDELRREHTFLWGEEPAFFMALRVAYLRGHLRYDELVAHGGHTILWATLRGQAFSNASVCVEAHEAPARSEGYWPLESEWDRIIEAETLVMGTIHDRVEAAIPRPTLKDHQRAAS